jgi:putative ATP-dependent endonuclease of the OLD family
VFLSEIHVANFRAIGRVTLRLDASTMLIGENGCGISSLLAALELALGNELRHLSAADVHRRGDGARSDEPVVIRLTFTERTKNEWSSTWHAPVGAQVPAQDGRRRIVIEFSTPAPGAGQASPLRARVAGVHEAAMAGIVRHVREMTPLLRIPAGSLTSHATTSGGRVPTAAATTPPAVVDLVRRVLGAADELLTGTAANPEGCIQAGAEAARELLALSPRHFDPLRAGLKQPIVEILGLDAARSAPAPARSGAPVTVDRPITTADRLGTLLLLSAILRRLPDGLAPGAEPLWVLEDPEAHLHPMTLAAAFGVLQRIRWQKIITTQSGDVLAAAPLAHVQRLVRHADVVHARGLTARILSREQLRRVGYHLRVHRGVAMFARVWLLVEGESEHWILPQVAQVLGYDLATEGICCVGFAQCGLDPLVRAAQAFGIEWHLLADGDEAGRHYVDQARRFTGHNDLAERITGLDAPDIEHCFWRHGHAEVIAEVAGIQAGADQRITARQAIARAVKRRSKPFLALKLVESVAARGPAAVPAPLAALIETCVRLARDAPGPMATWPADPRGRMSSR